MFEETFIHRYWEFIGLILLYALWTLIVWMRAQVEPEDLMVAAWKNVAPRPRQRPGGYGESSPG